MIESFYLVCPGIERTGSAEGVQLVSVGLTADAPVWPKAEIMGMLLNVLFISTELSPNSNLHKIQFLDDKKGNLNYFIIEFVFCSIFPGIVNTMHVRWVCLLVII